VLVYVCVCVGGGGNRDIETCCQVLAVVVLCMPSARRGFSGVGSTSADLTAQLHSICNGQSLHYPQHRFALQWCSAPLNPQRQSLLSDHKLQLSPPLPPDPSLCLCCLPHRHKKNDAWWGQLKPSLEAFGRDFQVRWRLVV